MVSTKKLFSSIITVQLLLVGIVCVLVLVCYLRFLWKYRDLFQKSWNYPGPLNLPLIGAAYLFVGKSDNILWKILKLQHKYPDGSKFWFGNRLIYLLEKPEHIEKILGSTKQVAKEKMYKYIVDEVGEGLLMSSVDVWKKHRKAIVPSFNQKILDSFIEIFAEKSAILADVLQDRVNEKNLDIFNYLSKCTLDTLCETAMGLNLDIQKNGSDHSRNFDRVMHLTFIRILQIWNHVPIIWKYFGYQKELQYRSQKMALLAEKVIYEKKKLMNNAQYRRPSVDLLQNTKTPRLAFLDYIMESGQLNSKELLDEVNMFLLAGTDTTAAALTFILTVLGIFPEVQENVYEELIGILGPNRAPESSDLPLMTYTERVIKETLRIFPVGGFFLRTVSEDVDMGGFVVPKGASAYFGLLHLHRNPKYWPNPLKFDPDRFLPEEVKKRHPCTYIPFSYGPRNCIGRVYGMMNIKVTIANLVRRFKFHCDYEKLEDIKLKTYFVLRFRDGPKLSFSLRNQQ